MPQFSIAFPDQITFKKRRRNQIDRNKTDYLRN